MYMCGAVLAWVGVRDGRMMNTQRTSKTDTTDTQTDRQTDRQKAHLLLLEVPVDVLHIVQRLAHVPLVLAVRRVQGPQGREELQRRRRRRRR